LGYYNRWWRFRRNRNLHEPLNELARLPDVNTQAMQECETERQLHERDRGERCDALPRSDVG
jgi:hypothetical protein